MNLTKEGIALKKVANCDVFVGTALKTEWNRLYGGQTLAQSLIACSLTVDEEYPVHSLHGYFILSGDCNKEILFQVDRTRDGKSFKTRSCNALQDNKIIFSAQVSFHKKEENESFQKLLPFPFKYDLSLATWKTGLKLTNEAFFTNGLRYILEKGDGWKVCAVKIQSELDLSAATWREQCGALTFLSDSGLVPIMRDLFTETIWTMSVSLDHSIHFHKPLKVNVNDWMYFYYQVKNIESGRALGSINIYNKNKILLATVSQELLLRKQSKL